MWNFSGFPFHGSLCSLPVLAPTSQLEPMQNERGCGVHPAALGRDFAMVQFRVEQGSSGGAEQPDSGGQITGAWIPEAQEPRHHDLPPRR